ncbi:MAG: DoxX family membrane protein [Candidatus Omnitrophica bacterium]|nr:DoxX family membrane protein [Candidatus Omnitrophota bacterium]
MFNLSMLVLRLVLGVIFVAYGAQKLFGTFDGIGLEGTAKMVEGLGFGNAYTIALAWACIEFIGGIFLMLGILARWSALAISLTMLVRIWKINLMYGFFLQNGGVEYGLLVVGACIPLILLGGGSWSVWDI